MSGFDFARGTIEPDELAAALQAGTPLRLIDATYAPDGAAKFAQKRIGEAAFFDIDQIADRASALPHMLPLGDAFATAVGALGISNDDTVVVYDQAGIHLAAARAWWMFRVFGHDKVVVLNGGLKLWEERGFAVTLTPPAPPAAKVFKASFRPALVRTMAQVEALLQQPDACVLDVRTPERYNGHAPEPWPGMRAGHMEGSRNAPFRDLIDDKGRLRSRAELGALLSPHLNAAALVSSCGSGVTACVTNLALFALGRDDAAVYDGSWSEWGHVNSPMKVVR